MPHSSLLRQRSISGALPLAVAAAVLLAAAGPLARTGGGSGTLGEVRANGRGGPDGAALQGAESPAQPPPGAFHDGPGVAPADDAEGPRGPARYVPALLERFDVARALGDTVFLDGFHRTPASPAYDASLDRLAATLREAGFGSDDRLRLEFIVSEEPQSTWWPEAGLLELEVDGEREVLLGFGHPAGAHRTLLPVGAPDAELTAELAFQLDDAEGRILVTPAPLSRPLVGRARSRGAVCVLSAATFPFTVDPSGGDEHLDAIKFASAPRGVELPVGQISERVRRRLEAAPEGARVRFHARAGRGRRPLRVLVAEIVGATRPGEAVVVASHVQEPGAGDNAAGAAGLAAAAAGLARALTDGDVPQPARGVVLVFGDEMRQSSIWLERGTHTAVAALSADMLGQSHERTGSVALLERTPDPGALYTLPPDAHTPWGAGALGADDLIPNGVNLVCRSAFADVATAVGGWRTSENPWEGGSDHDVFNREGVPAALMWHFTDFTYHTSLDRMDRIDGEELRRTCSAITAAALDLADLGPRDVERHLASNELERELRVEAARTADEPRAVDAWDRWCDGAAEWLRGAAVR